MPRTLTPAAATAIMNINRGVSLALSSARTMISGVKGRLWLMCVESFKCKQVCGRMLGGA